MKTYQDLLEVGDGEQARMDFVKRVINEYKASDMYKDAVIGEDYYNKKNTTIMQYQKTLRTITGKVIPDIWSANHKITSSFFRRFVTQQNQFVLGNGVTFNEESTKDKLGGSEFDTIMQKLGRMALVGAVSYGFWNVDHIDVFKATEFAPMQDEETGAVRAGVRWWQIDPKKPLRATLYEEDGFTEFIWRKDKPEGEIFKEKRGYKMKVTKAPVDADDDAIIEWENYPSFPIVPLWGNPEHMSEIIGIRNGIDAYDLIKNGYANELDSAMVYWIIKGAGGMDDGDLAQFLERLNTVHAAAPAEGQEVTPVPVNVPYEAREVLLNRIEHDLYRDYMAFDSDRIVAGAVTATAIRAAYEAINSKADLYEYQLIEFIKEIMRLAGVEDEPTFTRSMINNTSEMISSLIAGAQYLEPDYVTTKILTLLGDGDKAEEMLEQMAADQMAQIGAGMMPVVPTERPEPTEEDLLK